MPAIIKRLSAHGLQDIAHSASSLREAEALEDPGGVYTVSNTVQRSRVLHLDAHLDRLEASARSLGIPLQLQRARLRRALRCMILESEYGDVRFRISLSAADPQSCLLSIEPYQPPSPAVLRAGIRCITAPLPRQNPSSKASAWMRQRARLQRQIPPDVSEVLLLDARGAILEGASSNFYAILGGTLHSADSGILRGIARQIVLQICVEHLPLKLEPPLLGDLPDFQESFITSSSRGIIPVVAIDGGDIGTGQRGPFTAALQAHYQRWAATHAQEL